MSEKKATVSIEICSNCKEHKWCTRHNEEVYSGLATELLKEIQSSDNSIDVRVKHVGGSKMGSFEVSCEGTLLFSKLNLGYFPHTTALTARINNYVKDFRNGNDLSKYQPGASSPIKNNSQFTQTFKLDNKSSPTHRPVQLNFKPSHSSPEKQ